MHLEKPNREVVGVAIAVVVIVAATTTVTKP
jgi:hypothetical protein